MGVRVEFGLLGPLEVRCEGAVVPVAGGRQGALLAALLLEAGRLVTTGRARDAWQKALDILDDLHHLHAAEVRAKLFRLLKTMRDRVREIAARQRGPDSGHPGRVAACPRGALGW